jgi:hypothetical protein
MTAIRDRPAISAPDSGEARTYRQHVLAGRRPIQAILVHSIAWFVVGSIVFWRLLQPGPGALGRVILGLAIWIGPQAAIAVPALIGPRGRFRDWWWPRLIVRVDDGGVAWWTEGSVRRAEDAVAWTSVATVHPTLPSRNRPPGADCALEAPDGRVLAMLPCRLVRIDRPFARNRWRRVVWLPDVAVAIRPDRYRRRRLLGRRASLREPGPDVTG